MLPIDIQMQIDITAQMHKREIAEVFAKLRERLTPEPAELYPLARMLTNSLDVASLQQTYMNQAALAPMLNPMLRGLWMQEQDPQPYWYASVGLAGNPFSSSWWR